MKKGDFLVEFYGVRGSYPIVTKDTINIGGNTSCVKVSAGEPSPYLDSIKQSYGHF